MMKWHVYSLTFTINIDYYTLLGIPLSVISFAKVYACILKLLFACSILVVDGLTIIGLICTTMNTSGLLLFSAQGECINAS